MKPYFVGLAIGAPFQFALLGFKWGLAALAITVALLLAMHWGAKWATR